MEVMLFGVGPLLQAVTSKNKRKKAVETSRRKPCAKIYVMTDRWSQGVARKNMKKKIERDGKTGM